MQADDLMLSTVLVTPTSSSSRPLVHRPEVEVLGVRTCLLVEQTRAIRREALGPAVGRLSWQDQRLLDEALRLVFELDGPEPPRQCPAADPPRQVDDTAVYACADLLNDVSATMCYMDRIGIRELRQHASRYVARVAAGERIEVTDRGRPVAMLVPAEADRWQALIAAGRVRPAQGHPLDEPPQDYGIDASALLAELREIER